MATYVWDGDAWVEKGTETGRYADKKRGVIVRNYEHTARSLPLRAKLDRQGRVVEPIKGFNGKYENIGGQGVARITSKRQIENIIAANRSEFPKHMNGIQWDQ